MTVLVSDDGVLLIDDKFAMDHDGIMEHLRKITVMIDFGLDGVIAEMQ